MSWRSPLGSEGPYVALKVMDLHAASAPEKKKQSFPINILDTMLYTPIKGDVPVLPLDQTRPIPKVVSTTPKQITDNNFQWWMTLLFSILPDSARHIYKSRRLSPVTHGPKRTIRLIFAYLYCCWSIFLQKTPNRRLLAKNLGTRWVPRPIFGLCEVSKNSYNSCVKIQIRVGPKMGPKIYRSVQSPANQRNLAFLCRGRAFVDFR